jgi:hypothetical protein
MPGGSLESLKLHLVVGRMIHWAGNAIPMCPVQVEGPLGPETVRLGYTCLHGIGIVDLQECQAGFVAMKCAVYTYIYTYIYYIWVCIIDMYRYVTLCNQAHYVTEWTCRRGRVNISPTLGGDLERIWGCWSSKVLTPHHGWQICGFWILIPSGYD